jgi:hypothetical protein
MARSSRSRYTSGDGGLAIAVLLVPIAIIKWVFPYIGLAIGNILLGILLLNLDMLMLGVFMVAIPAFILSLPLMLWMNYKETQVKDRLARGLPIV